MNAEKRLLLVDDEEGFRLFFREVLEEAGFVIEEVSTGAEAVSLSEKQEYAMILLDGYLGGMTGLQVLEKIKEKRPDQRVVMLSVMNEAFASEAAAKGAAACVRKPTHPDDLEALVARHLKEDSR